KMGLLEVADRLSVTLSGGQKQRAMVATVMATEAPLMFLDEPTIGLDPFARRAVWDVLRELTRKGSTVLLTTHYLDEAEALSERLYIVEEGRILFEGTAADAKRQIGGTLRVSIENGGPVRDLFRSFGQTVEEGTALSVITGPDGIHESMDSALLYSMFLIGQRVWTEAAYVRIDHKLNELYHASPLSPEGYFVGIAGGMLVAYLPPSLVLLGILQILHPLDAVAGLTLIVCLLAVWAV